MRQTTTNEFGNPAVGSSVNERSVIGFSTGDDGRSPLDVLVREGARKMLQAALEAARDPQLQTMANQQARPNRSSSRVIEVTQGKGTSPSVTKLMKQQRHRSLSIEKYKAK